MMLKRLAPVLATIFLLACGGSEAPRGVAIPVTAFKDEITVTNAPSKMKSSETVMVDVTIRNLGDAPWPHVGDPGHLYGVLLAYHWLNADGSPAVFDGIRTGLPEDLRPGASVPVKASVQAPAGPGKYVLEFDMVQESVSWFKDRGAKAPRFPITVE